MEPEGSLPHLQQPATRPYLEPDQSSPGPRHMYPFRNKDSFYGEKFLAPRPTPKQEDHLLSAVHYCIFNIFAATLHVGGRSSIRNLRTRHAMLTGTHLCLVYHYLYIKCIFLYIYMLGTFDCFFLFQKNFKCSIFVSVFFLSSKQICWIINLPSSVVFCLT